MFIYHIKNHLFSFADFCHLSQPFTLKVVTLQYFKLSMKRYLPIALPILILIGMVFFYLNADPGPILDQALNRAKEKIV